MKPKTSAGGAPGAAQVIEPRLLEVEVYLTNRCNLDCSYCSARHMIRECQGQRLSAAQLIRALDLLAADKEVKRRYGGRVKITFKGGEPLLEYGAMKEAILHIARRRLGFEIGLTTNGTLLTTERMAFLADHGVEVCVSIDGYKEVNDRHRRFKGGAGRSVYDAVMRNLEAVLANERYRRHVHIGTTFTAQTIASVPGVVDFFSRRLGFRQLKIGIEVYGVWSRTGIAGLRATLRSLKARFLAGLPAALAAGKLEEHLGEVQFSQYMRNLPNVWSDGVRLNELAANPVALFYDGYFYPCDFALKPPLEEKYRIGGLDRGLDFVRFDRLCALPMFDGIPGKCEHEIGLLSPVERCCWGEVNGFGPARMDRLLRNTSEVNEVFNQEIGAYLRLQRNFEELFLTPGFGDLTHEPKYRGSREMRRLRLRLLPGSPLPRLREEADYLLYSPGRGKELLLEAAGPGALERAEALAIYAALKAGYLKKKLRVTVLPEAGTPGRAA